MSTYTLWHSVLGALTVGLNVLVTLLLRKDRAARRQIGFVKQAVAYIGQIILLIQVVLGLVLWAQGFRPAPGLWAYLHRLLPIGALLFAIMMLMRSVKSHPRDHATFLSKAAWHTTLVALVTYVIGVVG